MKQVKEASKNIPYTGIKFADNSTKVSSIYSNSPGETAGIYTFDEIIAINSYKVSIKNIEITLKNYEAGDILEIHLFRDGKLLTTHLLLKAPLDNKIEIIEIENISDDQKTKQNLFFYNQNKGQSELN